MARLRASVPLSLALVLMAACSEDEKNPQPVGAPSTSLPGGSPGGTVVETGGMDTTGSDTGGMDTTGASADTTGASADTTGPDETTSGMAETTGSVVTELLEGSLVDQAGVLVPPVSCLLRFHAPGQVDPSTGASNGVTWAGAFTIEELPAQWAVTVAAAGGDIAVGNVGYVGVVCDADGDLLYDDGIGGWYDGLPLTQITVPADGLDIGITVL